MAFTLGIDYGTNSVRALFVDVSDGRELATCVVDYPSATQAILLDPRDANLDFSGVMKKLIQIKEAQTR